MSILDETFNSFRELTDTVIEKTGKLMDVSRLKLTSAEISKEITKRYEALGRVVYDSQKAGTDIDGLVKECVRSIDALYGRLDDVNARVANLRDKKYCGACGAVVEKNALYCTRCGGRVDDISDSAKYCAASNPNTERVKEAADEVIEKAKAAAEDIADKAKSGFEDAKEAVEDTVEKLNDIIDGAADSAEDMVNKIKDNGSDIIDDIDIDDIEEIGEDIAEKIDDTISGE